MSDRTLRAGDFFPCRVEYIYISPGHSYFGRHGKGSENHGAVSLNQADLVAGRGIVGDRFFEYKENYHGQITFFAMEVFEDVCQILKLRDKPPSATRRNVFLRGIDLNLLIGKKFSLQGVSFVGSDECRPCYWMDEALGPGAENLMKGRGGLRARIVSDGQLRVDLPLCTQCIEVNPAT